MFAYIKGTLEMKMTDYVVIDVGGLGYKIYMSSLAMEKLGNIGEEVKVYTYYRVREDDVSIYGFNSNEELRIFELLLSVSGVGAKTALAMLAVCTPSEFVLAIVSEDINVLTSIPGIGPKSAKRIILELKDKIKKEQQIEELTKASKGTKSSKETETGLKVKQAIEDDNKILEAVAALQVLGYNKKIIEQAFEKIENKKELTTEELIKKGLRMLAKGI